MPRVRHRSKAVDIDHGQLVGRHLNRFAIVMHLHELAPSGGWAASRRDGWRFQRLAEVCQNLPDRPGRRDEGDQPDVTAAVWALERKLLPNPGQESRPRNPGGVMRAGLLIRGAAASGAVTVAPMLAGRGLAPLADIPDRQRRDGFSQLVVRREYSWLVSRRQAMPVLPGRLLRRWRVTSQSLPIALWTAADPPLECA